MVMDLEQGATTSPDSANAGYKNVEENWFHILEQIRNGQLDLRQWSRLNIEQLKVLPPKEQMFFLFMHFASLRPSFAVAQAGGIAEAWRKLGADHDAVLFAEVKKEVERSIQYLFTFIAVGDAVHAQVRGARQQREKEPLHTMPTQIQQDDAQRLLTDTLSFAEEMAILSDQQLQDIQNLSVERKKTVEIMRGRLKATLAASAMPTVDAIRTKTVDTNYNALIQKGLNKSEKGVQVDFSSFAQIEAAIHANQDKLSTAFPAADPDKY